MASNNTVLQLMTKVLGSTFAGSTWATWRAVLSAAFALDLTAHERAIVEALTQRQTLPSSPVRELWLLLGRRSGKSIIAALLAVWATTCKTYTLAPGEVGVFMVIASDRRQGRVIKRYISGLLRSHPSLDVLIDHETQEAIWLTNGLCIEIHTCSFRSLRRSETESELHPSETETSGVINSRPPRHFCSSCTPRPRSGLDHTFGSTGAARDKYACVRTSSSSGSTLALSAVPKN